jgi:flagellin
MGSASGTEPQITASNKENPMSLGVLNNLSAVYAENNLSNTNSNLSKTLQQLSSGSKINSGADDAAGLSLVDGLQANQSALTQSGTNAQEGVGLLQVADGALSQVTSLLNRAVTLATEASNGTLTGTQDAAANQEYQSILSEVSNIGSTTTYNQNKVFGNDVSIYTGDSSSSGASQNTLHLAPLSSTRVGDTGGSMEYSSGTNVFINLSKTPTNLAASGDAITETTGLSFSVWDNTTGQAVTKTFTGATVSALVGAVNAAGLGVSASLTTNADATGATGAVGLETGIMLSGNVSYSSGGSASAGGAVVLSGSDIYDSAAGGGNQSSASAPASHSGIATISYNSTGDTTVNLSTTDLSNQGDAEAALTQLNTAISDVAAQDGYIGAQINTLNSVSQVLSTQQENVQAAQNAVQATDYAQASSNMSKYEILSQTGISALAQANSVQQEVTKLLQ